MGKVYGMVDMMSAVCYVWLYILRVVYLVCSLCGWCMDWRGGLHMHNVVLAVFESNVKY